MKSRFACLVVSLLTLPLFTHAGPPLNVACEVELRRDVTGTPSGSGTRVGFTGTLKSLDKDWVCVDVGGELGEVWIPVSSIQFINFPRSKS